MIGAGLLLVMAGLQLDQVMVVIVGQLIIGSGFGTCNGYLNLTMMEAASDAERQVARKCDGGGGMRCGSRTPRSRR